MFKTWLTLRKTNSSEKSYLKKLWRNTTNLLTILCQKTNEFRAMQKNAYLVNLEKCWTWTYHRYLRRRHSREPALQSLTNLHPTPDPLASNASMLPDVRHRSSQITLHVDPPAVASCQESQFSAYRAPSGSWQNLSSLNEFWVFARRSLVVFWFLKKIEWSEEVDNVFVSLKTITDWSLLLR